MRSFCWRAPSVAGGKTALHKAAAKGHAVVVQLLLDAGMAVNSAADGEPQSRVSCGIAACAIARRGRALSQQHPRRAMEMPQKMPHTGNGIHAVLAAVAPHNPASRPSFSRDPPGYALHPSPVPAARAQMARPPCTKRPPRGTLSWPPRCWSVDPMQSRPTLCSAHS